MHVAIDNIIACQNSLVQRYLLKTQDLNENFNYRSVFLYKTLKTVHQFHPRENNCFVQNWCGTLMVNWHFKSCFYKTFNCFSVVKGAVATIKNYDLKLLPNKGESS